MPPRPVAPWKWFDMMPVFFEEAFFVGDHKSASCLQAEQILIAKLQSSGVSGPSQVARRLALSAQPGEQGSSHRGRPRPQETSRRVS